MALTRPFGGIYNRRRVLVTGHTGFKGSWLVYWLSQMGAEVTGLALDPETTPSHWNLLALTGVRDLRVDLRESADVERAFKSCQPEIVFHLGAQALVRRSYRDPAATFSANVIGLVNLLESVRHCPSVRVVVNATTDKVYADGAAASGYRESDPLGGHDPYSTSKACAELVSDSYRRSFFGDDDGRGFRVRLATARAGNVIGGGDWAEDRLVPDMVRAAASQQPLQLRNPAATRPWQHVLEPLSGYLRLGQVAWDAESFSEAWNFGPEASGEVTVGEIATRVARHWLNLEVQCQPGPHPHEAASLRLDSRHAREGLSWRPVWTLDTAIERTAAWYRAFNESGRLNTPADLAAYTGDASRLGLAWAT